MKRAVIVLGASGRLGRRVLPVLAESGFDIAAVTRTPLTVGPPQDVHWITADVTLEEDRTRIVATLEAWAAGHGHICVVDTVLDRSGVAAMRRSIQGATSVVFALRERFGDGRRTCALVAASTTAVLASSLYQTPYGLAKRRQVITYARAGIPGAALLLPQLAQRPSTGPVDEAAWSFEQAACRVVEAVLAAPSRSSFAVYALDFAAPATKDEDTPLSAAGTAVLTHLHSLILSRDCMQAHRAAARSRLRLTPQRLRGRVDHHLAPVGLVRRFAERHHISIIDERTAGSSLNRRGPVHA
ncbi:hypothetical protein [Micromonospora sp. CPCC 206061]|uniref:hypothetical protein n=1 Tax=Micromonospora sp. CPCC 206061 TaxID=3122410 RepID=UPI002FEE7FED